MPIIGETIVDPATYRTAVRVLSRQHFLVIRIVGGVLAALGVALLVIGSTALLPVAAGSAAAGLMFAVWMPVRLVHHSSRRAAPALAGPWRYEIDDAVVRVATPLARSEWPWQTFTSGQDHPDFWLLRTPIKGQALIVVKRALNDADRLDFARLAQERGLLARANT
jgi:hypothetical protein